MIFWERTTREVEPPQRAEELVNTGLRTPHTHTATMTAGKATFAGTPPIPTVARGATQQTLTRDGNIATSPPAPKIPTRPRAGIGGRAKGWTTGGQSQSRRQEPPAKSGPKPTWATGGTARWASGDGRTTSAGTQTSRTVDPGAMCLAPRTPTTLADKDGTTALFLTAKVRTREKRIQTCTTASSGQGTPCANTLAQRRSVPRKRR